MAITTAAAWKAYRQTSATTWDTLVTDVLIPTAQAEIEAYTDRVIESATYTDEAYSGDGSQELLLRNWPVTVLTSIKVKADDGTTTTLDSSDYRADLGTHNTGLVVRLPYTGGSSRLAVDDWGEPLGYRSQGASFPEGFQNILVTYTGGYATVPANIVLAAHRLIDHYLSQRGVDIGVSNDSQGNRSSTFRGGMDIDLMKRSLLGPYRRLPS